MLTIYRRHVKGCAHKHDGRKYRRCRCPIWADGFLNGVEIRESMNLRDWEKAQQRINAWEAEGVLTAEAEEPTIERACQAFENDAKARGLREPTLKKYRVLFRQLQAFAQAEGLRFIKECELGTLRKFRGSGLVCVSPMRAVGSTRTQRVISKTRKWPMRPRCPTPKTR